MVVPKPEKDLWLTRASVLMLTIGAFMVSLTENPVLIAVRLAFIALGSGYTFLVRSLLISVLEKRYIGTRYTMIRIFKTVGALLAGPLLAASYRTGLDYEGLGSDCLTF